MKKTRKKPGDVDKDSQKAQIHSEINEVDMIDKWENEKKLQRRRQYCQHHYFAQVVCCCVFDSRALTDNDLGMWLQRSCNAFWFVLFDSGIVLFIVAFAVARLSHWL